MNQKLFREFLVSRGYSENEITHQVEKIKNIELGLQKHVPFWTLDDINAATAQDMVDEMIDCGENSEENFEILLHYARAVGNNDLFVTVFSMLDGSEAMKNLHAQLGERVGEDLRDVIFEGMPLPPLGLSRHEKARFTNRIIRRMVNVFEEDYCREILADSLRDLPDEYYIEAKSDFYERCEGDLDCYLVFKKEKFIETLQKYQAQDQLFFGQEITDAVIDFIKNTPEMGGGKRTGNIIYETKIPYNTKAFLEEQDSDLKRYHYCHCPWARESLRNNLSKVSPIFCQCSAGFHKKPWEAIFGEKLRAEVLESVLQGDEHCRFAIYLPDRFA